MKDGSFTWNKVKDSRESFPFKLADYVVLNQIVDEPEFTWWIKKVLKKRDRIISKMFSKYWPKTHNYGLCIPHTVKEAIEIQKKWGHTMVGFHTTGN